MRKFKNSLLAVLLLLAFINVIAILAPEVRPARADAMENYIVLYKLEAVPADAATTIANAGGTLVKSYDVIGVAIARSDSTSFRDNLLNDSRIENAAATTSFGVSLKNDQAIDGAAEGPPLGDLPNLSASDSDNLSHFQWDMRQIHTPEAHQITGGSPSVVVGNIDTGIDKDHPDLQSNLDFANSCSCIGGVPNQDPNAWDDHRGHGTHTAGTIAAAANGIGIVGVAPNVKVAAIKAGNDDGFFFPEAVICAFMWAATHHLDVTNNSYFADPYLFNCRNDPVQRAIWKAEQRAIRYALNQGVTVVAALGNQGDDLAHPEIDNISPDFPPGSVQEREITNACLVIPVEIPGVIGVSADGPVLQKLNDPGSGYLKTDYSNYGIGITQVVAPGGNSPNAGVLSASPAEAPCVADVIDPGPPISKYCFRHGTSMASPHVAGLAALIISRFGNLNSPENGKMSPGQVAALIRETADPQPCPDVVPSGYLRPSGSPQNCEGGPANNSWYGSGQVNALKAVTGTSAP
jgi:subtilisin family serine protease